MKMIYLKTFQREVLQNQLAVHLRRNPQGKQAHLPKRESLRRKNPVGLKEQEEKLPDLVRNQ